MYPIWDSVHIERFAEQHRRAEPPFPSLCESEWLAKSCAAPQVLPLCRFLSERGPAIKSHPGQGFDFFHDLVLRHPASGQQVLRSYSRQNGWRSLSRAELFSRSARLGAAWAERGVAAGQRIALVLPMSPEYVVALTTALRMGLIVCPLPPRGPLLMAHRLAKLAPDFVYTTSLYHSLVFASGISEQQLLVDEPPSSARDDYYGSFTYPPESPALALFSPLYTPAEKVTQVSSSSVFAGAIADLLLCFVLNPGEALAAPGVLEERYLPGLLLSALLGGVLFVHLELEDYKNDPKLLSAAPLQLLLMTRAFCDHLLALPKGALGPVECVLRDPVESADLGAWQRLVAAQGLGKTAIGNLIYDSCSGGCILFSPRRRGTVTNELLPAPCRRYGLMLPEVISRPAIGQGGVFIAEGAARVSEERAGVVVLGRKEDVFVFGGTLTPRWEGRVYPEESALAALCGLSFIDGAAFALVPALDGSGRSLLVLVVLTGVLLHGPFNRSLAARIEALRHRLGTQLGESFLPDKYELFPLLARRRDGVVDVEHLRSEYLSGALFHKSRDPKIAKLQQILFACHTTALERLRAAKATGFARSEAHAEPVPTRS